VPEHKDHRIILRADHTKDDNYNNKDMVLKVKKLYRWDGFQNDFQLMNNKKCQSCFKEHLKHLKRVLV